MKLGFGLGELGEVLSHIRTMRVHSPAAGHVSLRCLGWGCVCVCVCVCVWIVGVGEFGCGVRPSHRCGCGQGI